MVIWFIGLSGSGKSYFANQILKILNKKKIKTIHIDGDEVRKYITKDLKYSVNDRKKNSILISGLCKFLEAKGYTVICSILSIFPKHQKNNRKIFKKYIQIFIDVDLNKLKKRNNKRLYDKRNVIGKKIKFPKPYKSDLIISNNFQKKKTKIDLKRISKIIYDKL